MLADVGNEALDAAYEEFGTPAQYRAGGAGAPTVVTVIQLSPDRIARFGEGQFVVGSSIIKVRASEVSAAALGDTFCPGAIVNSVFVPGDRLYTVFAAPRREDPARLEWTCWVR